MDRGGNKRKRGTNERAGKPHRRAKPIQRLPNDAKGVCKGGRACLLSCNARGRASTGDGIVLIWEPAEFESTACDGRYGMITGDRLTDIECSTKCSTRRNEECGAPGGDAGELTCPQYVLDRLTAFAAGASALIKDRANRVRPCVPKDAATQKSSTIVPDRHHHGALLVVELSKPEKLDVARPRVHRGRYDVLRAHDVQIVHV